MKGNYEVTIAVRKLIDKINKPTYVIARKIGVSTKSLNRWYSGEFEPTTSNYFNLCRLAGLSPWGLDPEGLFYFVGHMCPQGFKKHLRN